MWPLGARYIFLTRHFDRSTVSNKAYTISPSYSEQSARVFMSASCNMLLPSCLRPAADWPALLHIVRRKQYFRGGWFRRNQGKRGRTGRPRCARGVRSVPRRLTFVVRAPPATSCQRVVRGMQWCISCVGEGGERTEIKFVLLRSRAVLVRGTQ